MTRDRETVHPAPQSLAAFADGRLGVAERAALVEHLDRCDACMSEVALGMAAGREEAKSRGTQRPWLFALAAAFALAIVAVGVMRDVLPFGRSSIARLVALAPRSERLVEARLSGGFPWAGYAGADRASAKATDAARLKLAGAAGDLVERADRDHGVEPQHAAGVALMLVQKPVDAIARLETVASGSRNAKMWSDLAAARYAAASQLGRASLYPQALAAADAALRLEPGLPEGLFNRALILERLGLTEEAKGAWKRYLEVDPSSSWATEARARLADLPVSTRSSQFDRDRPRMEKAAERNDAKAVRNYVDAHRDRARAYVEAEYLGRWGEAVQRRDAVDAARWLLVSRTIANALMELSGDALAHDAVAAIDRAPDSARHEIAEGHVAYRAGRIAYSRHALDDAERDLLHAAQVFDAAGDPMALAARYYAASVRLSRNETIAARADLERVRSEIDAHPTFVNLRARVRWELGRAHMVDEDWSGALPVLTEGADAFRRSGDGASEAFVEAMLARSLAFMGRADDAWLARIRAFAALSAEGETELLGTALDAATHAELQAGRGDAALTLSVLALSVARSGMQPQAIVYALLNQAMLQVRNGDSAGALLATQQAGELARAAGDPALRMRQLADVAAAAGSALVDSDPRGASISLSRAIAFYEQHNVVFALPEPLLLRARCAVRTGDPASAMRDLESGIAIVERRRSGDEGIAARTSVLDAEHALFEDAIRLCLDRGDSATAFAFAERFRGGSISRTELQRRLAGSGVVVVEIVALPAELITFAVAENDTTFARRPRSRETLRRVADECLSEPETAAAVVLYDAVIRPVDSLLGQARELVIVPDPRLQNVPFAALYDKETRRHLIDRFALSIASNASSLQTEVRRRDAPSVVVIALPNDGLNAEVALPEAGREVEEVTALYSHARAMGPSDATLAALRDAATRGDVLHVVGHTESLRGGGDQALLLAGDDGAGVDRVSWKTILASPPFGGGLVVLAACETLRPPASAATRALSLGEAFAAAGARDVVGTLAPIGDRDARLLFAAFHRRIAMGDRPADALRAVQQEAIARDPVRGGRRAWRAVALLTRSIPAPGRR